MAAKKKKVPYVGKTMVTTTSLRYFIFELTDEGHLRQPKYNDYGAVCSTFDSWSGYETMSDAQAAVVARLQSESHTSREYSFGARGKYYILPRVEVSIYYE